MSLRSQQVRPVEIGEMARHLRKLRDLTLEAAAAELGVSASGLSQAERGVERMLRLALRSVNEHLARGSEVGLVGHGHIREQFQAYGGAEDILGKVRGPEVARRGGLLRQALLARGVDLVIEGHTAHVAVVQARVEVDLRDMSVVAIKDDGRPRGGFLPPLGMPLGRIIDTDEVTLDEGEVWAEAIDRFASAVIAATKTPGLFKPELIQKALRFGAPPKSPSTSPNDGIET